METETERENSCEKERLIGTEICKDRETKNKAMSQRKNERGKDVSNGVERYRDVKTERERETDRGKERERPREARVSRVARET
jgi:hypothetical protein